jgi:hypothetical protein
LSQRKGRRADQSNGQLESRINEPRKILALRLGVDVPGNRSPGDREYGQHSGLTLTQSERVPGPDGCDPEVGLNIVDVQRRIEQNAAFRLAEAT